MAARCFERWRRMDERWMLSSSRFWSRERAASVSTYVAERSVSLVRSSVAASAGETMFFVARFARFAGLAPPTAPYYSSEATAEVLELDDGEDSSRATDKDAAASSCLWAEKAAAFSKRRDRLAS